MIVVRDELPKEFLKLAGPLLYSDEETHSLMLGLCENMVKASEPPKNKPVLLRIVKDNQTLATAIQTPPMNLILSYAKQIELETLAKYLKLNGIQFPGVVGPAKESLLFSKIWSDLTATKFSLGMGQKIYKIQKVNLPKSEGQMRLAKTEEVEIIANWLFEFSNESLPVHERKPLEGHRPQAKKVIEDGRAFFWIMDSQAVTMTIVGRATLNGISVFGVYTSPEFRRQGYASALVANVSQKMLESGRLFCVLYTDTSNPTSNKIYQKIGYTEVAGSAHYLFGESIVQP